MSVAEKRGVFVVLEGLDRVGKTSIKSVLGKMVQEDPELGPECFTISFPDRTTETGKVIDAFLKREKSLEPMEVHNLYGDNRTEKMGMMQETLQAGTCIISDRYVYSGCSYTLTNLLSRKSSSQTTRTKQDMEMACQEYLKELCKTDINQLIPDVIIHLTTETESVEDREGFGDEVYETKAFAETVRDLGYPQTYAFYLPAHMGHGTKIHRLVNRTDTEFVEICGEQKPRALVEVCKNIMEIIRKAKQDIVDGHIAPLERYAKYIVL